MKYFWSLMPALVAGLFSSCQPARSTDDAPASFLVTRVISKDTTLYREYVGDIDAHRNVEIRARVPGYLDQIFVDEGQFVKKGQPLFRINDEEYRAALAQAKGALNSAEAESAALQLEVERVKILVDKNVVSTTELRLAQAKYEASRARVEEARSAVAAASIRLSQTVIQSPFDGMIDRIPFKIGSLINEGSLLTTVSDTRDMFVYFKVSEQEYLQFRRQKEDTREEEVELILADGTYHQYKGRIETMEGEFDERTGTIAFRARFANPQNLLKHGSSGKVRMGARVRKALLVPQKSTFEIQDRTFVYRVNDDGQVSSHSFDPEQRFSHFYIVKSGLREGDAIIYEGIQNVRDGMRVRPRYVKMDSVLAIRQGSSNP